MKPVHFFFGERMARRRWNMDEFFRVVLINDFSEGNCFLGNNVTMLATAAGNHQLARLLKALDGMENNIFLQHAIIAKCRLS